MDSQISKEGEGWEWGWVERVGGGGRWGEEGKGTGRRMLH